MKLQLEPGCTIDSGSVTIQHVESSNVRIVGYAYLEETKEFILIVGFKQAPSLWYLYRGFRMGDFKSLVEAESVGRYLNQIIIPNSEEIYKVEVTDEF